MSLKIGIVGLPNVGKSTLFNAITNSKVEASNYPFATIDANVGIVEVKDERLDALERIFNSKKKLPTTIEFVDIAGLIAGASKGEGLGNAFLANIRETDAICEVVRCFDSVEITHVEGSVDPIRDIEIINIELMLADEATIQKRIKKLEPSTKDGKNKDAILEFNLLSKMLAHLKKDNMLNTLEYTDDEKLFVKSFQLLTTKKIIYVANVMENEIAIDNDYVKKVKEYADKQNTEFIKISAKIEEELSELSKEDRDVFLSELKIELSGLDQLTKISYDLLNLQTYFTAGPEEARAWQFKKGSTAPECAGIIHTDFEKGFIKADIYKVEDIIELGNKNLLKDAGKIRLEGKKYIVQDGDVCFFKFNV